MTTEDDKTKPRKAGLWQRIFGGWKKEDPDKVATDLPMQDAFGNGGSSQLQKYLDDGDKAQGDYEELIKEFPLGRLDQYGVLQIMATDPTIDSALKMHIAHALSGRTDTGEIVFIESATGDADDEIVADLNRTFKEILNRDLPKWAYTTALYGVCYVRPYGASGKGISHIRHDYYTHPSFVREYERAGLLCGFWAKYQQVFSKGLIRLMEPWKMVSFKIPQWVVHSRAEPLRNNADFDLDDDDYLNEEPIECQDYGSSLIRTAYHPWIDLNEAILALNISRRNASKKDRFVSVNIGRENPQKAAQYLKAIAGQIKRKAEASARRALSRGYVNTVETHLLPVWNNGSGRVEISTETQDVNIASIEDMNFHVNRLASALGVDKSLLGFTDDLSGGLGDGGFFRISVIAAIKANLIRQAMSSGIERLFEIHVAQKFGKVYEDDEKPWKLTFNSLSTAIEAEESSAKEQRANYATTVVGLLQALAEETPEAKHWILVDLLKADEDKIKELLKKKEPEEQAEANDGDSLMDSATSNDHLSNKLDQHIKSVTYDTIAELYNNGSA